MFIYRFLCECTFSPLWHKCPGVQPPGYNRVVWLVWFCFSKKLLKCFPKCFYHFTFIPAIFKWFISWEPCQNLGVSFYFYFILVLFRDKWWRRQWQPTPVLLPGNSHGQRSLVDCSPWGREESDRTERLHFHFSLSCIGEGNGNPLQCSCLENPRVGGAWWAAIYGAA